MTIRKTGLGLLLGLSLVVAPAWAAEHGGEIRLKSKMVEGGYLHEFTERDAVWAVRALHREDRGDAITSSFHVVGDLSPNDPSAGLRAGLGGEVAAVDVDGGGSGLAVAVGGFLVYVPPVAEKLSFQLDALWAPEVLTMGDIDSYLRIGIEAGYGVFQGGTVFVGARNIRIEVDDVKGYLDTGVHAGFRIKF